MLLAELIHPTAEILAAEEVTMDRKFGDKRKKYGCSKCHDGERQSSLLTKGMITSEGYSKETRAEQETSVDIMSSQIACLLLLCICREIEMIIKIASWRIMADIKVVHHQCDCGGSRHPGNSSVHLGRNITDTLGLIEAQLQHTSTRCNNSSPMRLSACISTRTG